jgi:RNA polymerase sigma-70 factor (ECF subfamily)
MADVEQLYLQNREALSGYFLRRHRSRETAEDLLQETFLRLMRPAERCLAATSPRGYWFGIARHVSADAWRRAAAKTDLATPTHPLPFPEQTETAACSSPDSRLQAAREIITSLPALQREILDLRFQHDLSYAAIAAALGIPVGTVRWRLHNALAMLRQRLENEP